MHLEGMLDRDQRTAKIRLYCSDKQVPKTTNSFRDCNDNVSCSKPSSIISNCTKSSTNFLYLNWRKGYLIHSFQRLKNVLLVLVYLTLVTLPTTNSAPTNVRMSTRLKEHPKWMNPCGISSQDNTDFIPKLKDSDLKPFIAQVAQQAGLALTQAKKFKDIFTERTFNRKFEEISNDFEPYTWLPTLTKADPNEDLRVQIEKTLLNAYKYLQTIAVGLEQVVWDQQDRPGHFPNEFKEQESYLIVVLCELQNAMIEMNVQMRSDVPRDVMPEDLRFNLDVTQSNVRDFIILREYINTLEYVTQVFTHLERRL